MKFRKIFNLCNFYILLWILYMFHWYEAAIPVLESFSNAFLGINLLISIYCAVKLLKEGNFPQYFKAVTILLISFSIYGAFSIVFGEVHMIKFSWTTVNNGTYLVSVLRSFLPVYAFYYFSLKGQLTLESMKQWTVVLVVVSVFLYFHSYALHLLISNKDEFTNNTGYVLLSLFPLVFLFDKRISIQYILVGLISVFVLSALKRGAILINIILLVYFLHVRLKNATRSQKKWFYLASILFVVAAVYFLQDFVQNSALFQERLQDTLEGNTSGRSQITDSFKYYYFHEANFFQMIFGSGADATLDIGINYAHNDWWELLIDQGLLGLVIYLYYWKTSYQTFRSMRSNKMMSEIFGSTLILYFVRCFFSMSYSILPLVFGLSVGFALANKDNYELNNE